MSTTAYVLVEKYEKPQYCSVEREREREKKNTPHLELL